MTWRREWVICRNKFLFLRSFFGVFYFILPRDAHTHNNFIIVANVMKSVERGERWDAKTSSFRGRATCGNLPRCRNWKMIRERKTIKVRRHGALAFYWIVKLGILERKKGGRASEGKKTESRSGWGRNRVEDIKWRTESLNVITRASLIAATISDLSTADWSAEPCDGFRQLRGKVFFFHSTTTSPYQNATSSR